ncbi:olfactory receptor 14A2-like [Tachyglossus aculeatus]|uniref:olfactory receptor 14A2-like n=1 Tax=Tachyglossus aculeatus TaxID=9261 RepID=UPI0018F36CC9|nr:olfactory receptor 14A2-like [Tachyglossus aculeatus]
MANDMAVRDFLLLGFTEVRKLQLVYAALFFLVYLEDLTGNHLIEAINAFDRRLHISTLLQLSIITATSYDRYTAICLPLVLRRHHGTRVLWEDLAQRRAFRGDVLSQTFTSSFCVYNVIQQFFCDVPSLLKISCSEAHVVSCRVAVGIGFGFVSFISIVLSYVLIFSAVLRFPSTESQAKAFSTRLPQFTIVTVFLSTGAFAYLKPISISVLGYATHVFSVVLFGG